MISPSSCLATWMLASVLPTAVGPVMMTTLAAPGAGDLRQLEPEPDMQAPRRMPRRTKTRLYSNAMRPRMRLNSPD